MLVRRVAARAALATLLAAPTLTARAQQLDSAARHAIADSLANAVQNVYVDADTAALVARKLRERNAAGVYDTIANARGFASRLTADMRSVVPDLHLAVEVTPPGGIATSGARLQHYGFANVDLLPGNVGYLQLVGFSSDSMGRSALASAMRFIDGFDALIVDVRRNPGGSALLTDLFMSYFLPDSVALTETQARDGTKRVRYTARSVTGVRYPNLPLYIVTSSNSASGAEDMAFTLQNLKRATIIGETTRGAGRGARYVDLGHGMRAIISNLEIRDPRSGRRYERIGIKPDIAADTNNAVNIANRLAVRNLVPSMDPDRANFARIIDRILTAWIEPVAVDPAVLNSYAGTYEGNKRIGVIGNRLAYEAEPGALPRILTPLSASSFADTSGFQFSFDRDEAGVMRMRAPGPRGQAVYARLP